MTETRCRSEYVREGGREPGDRIVRCDLPADHPGEHEEADTEVTWTDAPAAREQATPSSDRLWKVFEEAQLDCWKTGGHGIGECCWREGLAAAVAIAIDDAKAALAAREAEVCREERLRAASVFNQVWTCHAHVASPVPMEACTESRPHGDQWACGLTWFAHMTGGQFRRFFGEGES